MQVFNIISCFLFKLIMYHNACIAFVYSFSDGILIKKKSENLVYKYRCVKDHKRSLSVNILFLYLPKASVFCLVNIFKSIDFRFFFVLIFFFSVLSVHIYIKACISFAYYASINICVGIS